MQLVLTLGIALLWFFSLEFYRGRPSTSGAISFWLSLINPLGVILICLLGALIYYGVI